MDPVMHAKLRCPTAWAGFKLGSGTDCNHARNPRVPRRRAGLTVLWTTPFPGGHGGGDFSQVGHPSVHYRNPSPGCALN